VVKVDPAQVDQVLANLCVNARDAISGVGKVTIETQNVTFDETYCALHADCLPGDYVLLAVSDDGCGMPPETLEKIFEPFFTTKEVGQGTGLGLATVYGIARQNGGFINVYSEPGKGSVFRIYLPRQPGESEDVRKEKLEEIPQCRGELVLLVEDEAAMLRMGQMMLERLGYRVLAAGKPSQAMRLAGDHFGEIDLLVTDVVMPEMSGRELARQVHALHPQLKVMYMSGYTANAIVHRGELEPGVHFIQKPFSMKDLAAGVRKVLDGTDDR
jgi:CheY-like chemotaxis protein